MADPTGLVSLGVEVAGRLLKVRSTIDHRKKLIGQLAERLDEAHVLLLSARSGDYAAIYSEILCPLIDQSVALLESVNARSRAEAFKYSVVQPSHDVAEADRLIRALEQAPRDIEIRCVHQTMRAMVILQRNNNIPAGNGTKIRNVYLAIVAFAYFLSSGESSVTPLCIESTHLLLSL